MNIVIVKQEQDIGGKMVANVLKEQNENHVEIFQNGKDALAYIRDHPVDIVFAYIDANGIDGYSLTSYIKDMRKKIKVTLISDGRKPGRAMLAWNAHANYYLEYPFTREDVMGCLNEN